MAAGLKSGSAEAELAAAPELKLSQEAMILTNLDARMQQEVWKS